MKILIVEDEELSAERLEKLILTADPNIEILGIFASVFQTITFLENETGLKPDLIFLDIHLEDGDGFRIIDSLNLLTPVIFTTAFDSYTLRAFKANSVDYLLKPINPLELQASILKYKRILAASENGMAQQPAASSANSYKDRFLCTAGNRIFTFQSSEIAYFIIEQRATFLRLFDGRHFAIELSLEKLAQLTDPEQFFRINRTLLISVRAIGNMQVIAAGKLKVDLVPPVSREVLVSSDSISAFKIWLGK